MDLVSVFGVLLGLIAILGGNYLEGGHIGALINGPAALIVFGGTFGAAAVQTPGAHLRLALRRMVWIFLPPKVEFSAGIERMVNWAMTSRKEGLLGLESIAEEESDRFAGKGLQMLVDGAEPEMIRNVLEVESMLLEGRDTDAARFYECMGGYAPTIGIIGAVMGLIQVMGNLADPSALGPGIAVAFIATIYGVAAANLLFLPVGGKLRSLSRSESAYREMVIEGLIAIAEGENPRAIELKLAGFLDHH